MVPSAFVVLGCASADFEWEGGSQGVCLLLRAGERTEDYVAPRSAVEEGIAAIWSEVLHVERVGVSRNFFDLGGHSLLATQVISRIRSAFEVDLPLRALFEAPTVAGLAEYIGLAPERNVFPSPPLVPVSGEGALPLSFAQQGLWFTHRLDPLDSAYQRACILRFAVSYRVGALQERP